MDCDQTVTWLPAASIPRLRHADHVEFSDHLADDCEGQRRSGEHHDDSGGSHKIDHLNGGANADTFILGDGSRRHYDDGLPTIPGLGDYAVIEDFTPSQNDRLRLTGSASRYFLAVSPIPGLAGTALYHDSAGDSVSDTEADELIAILISTETLTVANTLNPAVYPPALDLAGIGLMVALQTSSVTTPIGPRTAVTFSILEVIPAGRLLEIQASTDLGAEDPWRAIASKNGPATRTGPSTVTTSAPSGGQVLVTVIETLLQPHHRSFYRARLLTP